MSLSIPAQLLLSLVLGAIIGLERESYEDSISKNGERRVGGLGVRTFSLITLLGTVSGLLRADYFSLFLTINITYMLLLLAYYIIGSFFTHDNGLTTEIAMAFAYIIGLSVSLQFFPIQIVLAITVVLIMVMSYKQQVRHFIAGIHRKELSAFISYALISLVVLPFLPNVSYSISAIPGLLDIASIYGLNLDSVAHVEILNPYSLWFVVALITGVDILGYVLERTLGQNRGWILASMTGGFISSTATTQSLAQQSQKNSNINLLVSSAIFANLASFFNLFLLISIFNADLLIRSSLLILMLVISSTLCGLYFLNSNNRSHNAWRESNVASKDTNILSLGPALKFAFLFLFIKTISKIALAFFGQSGFLAASGIAALAGLDAVIINLAELAGHTISYQTALLTIIMANAVNLIGKMVYSYIQGNREFAYKFSLGMLIVILFSFIGLIH